MKKLPSGHEITKLEGEENDKLRRHLTGYGDGLVRVSPDRWLFPGKYYDYGEKYYNFEFRKGDVLVMTYPKCGTTWTQEIVWTMKNNPDLNHPDAGWAVMDRVPFIEFDVFFPNMRPTPAMKKYCTRLDLGEPVNWQLSNCLPDPRTLKTHLPFSLFQPGILEHTKVVYVARNPKDMLVSYFHHHRLIRGQDFVGTLEDFADYFIQDDLVYGPYWLHLKEAWEKRDHPNMHFVFYEDMKTNNMGELKKLDAFLDTSLSEQELENISKYTSFSEMQARDSLFIDKEAATNDTYFNQEIRAAEGGFFRQGKPGNWKEKMTPEVIKKIDDWISEKCNFGIQFK